MAEWCAENLRDVQAWKDYGLDMSTPSNEAAKEFDGLLRQLISWTDCPQLGGLAATSERMIAADPDSVICRTFKYGLETMGTGTSALINPKLAGHLEKLQKDAASYGTDWEKDHVKGVTEWSYGHYKKAAETWDGILEKHPTDLLAVKFAHEAYFFMGDCHNKRDSILKVLPKWNKDIPCYSYLHGMLAFGQEECGEYRKAEESALKALDLNRFDCWATHARAHVLEMEGRHEEGIKFLESTEEHWRPGWIIATHNYWHNALYYIEEGNYEAALSIFDREVAVRAAKRSAVLDMVDASSLLLRLEMEGVDVGSRWRDLPTMVSHSRDHITTFNDVHLGPMFNRRGETDVENDMHTSLVNFTKSQVNDNAKICELVGQSLYEGMIDYCNEKYADAAEKMLPVRRHVQKIGGSHAQRDIFSQALIHACIMSDQENHYGRVPALMKERASIRSGHSPLAERLFTQFKLQHPLEENGSNGSNGSNGYH